jgi:hypothetical protein
MITILENDGDAVVGSSPSKTRLHSRKVVLPSGLKPEPPEIEEPRRVPTTVSFGLGAEIESRGGSEPIRLEEHTSAAYTG